ncbi:tyrosine-type recombinase/integrase [Paenibacillus tundrae]
MKGHFYKPHCKCTTKKCKCSATWSYIIDVGINPATGKRKQKKKGGFATKAEAEDHAAALQVELKQGTYVEEKEITFAEFTEIFIKIYSGSGKVKVSTSDLRRKEINRLMKYLQYYKMKNITLTNYQDMLYSMKYDEDYAHNTLIGTHRTAKMIFKKAIEMNVIKKDPTEFSYIPKEQQTVEDLEADKEEVKYLEKEELKLFLDTAALQGLERDHLIFTILSYTGMRSGELCALKWKDIDFENQELSITKTLYNPNNKAVDYGLLTPKTTTSRRTITIDPEVIDVLKAHRKLQNEVKMKYRDTYHDKDFVIAKTSRTPGYPEMHQFINWRMHRLLNICKLDESLTPHSLRHTHTSLLAEAGAELHEIMERLGHKDDTTTETVYLHVTKSRKKDTSSKFSALMKSIK